MDILIAALFAVAVTGLFVVLPVLFFRRWRPFASPRSGFLSGIGCTLVFLGALWLWSNFHISISGGRHKESPNGAWRVDVMAPNGPTAGGCYDITIRDNGNKKTIRKYRFQLDRNVKTVALRGADGVITWSPESDFADIALGEIARIRVFIP